MSLSQPSMDGVLDAIAKEGCSSLLEEVFLDLEVGALSPAPRWALPTRCRIDTLPGSVPLVSGWELVVVTGKYWTELSTAHRSEAQAGHLRGVECDEHMSLHGNGSCYTGTAGTRMYWKAES